MPSLLNGRIAGALAALLLWQLAALVLADPLLPGPLAVAARLGQLASSGELWRQLLPTLARVAVAFLLAMACGSVLGVLMGRRARLDAALDAPLMVALNLPALVTMMLCYVWFGLGEFAAVLAVALNKIPMVAVALREGARALDERLLQVGTVYGLSRGRVLRHIWLPQLAPYLLGAARNGLALVWKIVLVVELLGRPNGVGFALARSFHDFDVTGVLAYAGAFVAVIALVEALLLRPLEQRCRRWRA
ncbi:ABC transporter permease subunit [Solimonas variicoloris]|uniref:ABC transporter permease n=1 Tax=Solimonas variicoloris TaxID=254408 RepID=UPI000585374C